MLSDMQITELTEEMMETLKYINRISYNFDKPISVNCAGYDTEPNRLLHCYMRLY